MSSEQPSLFDQLTPSDSLRDDLEWIDSLQEDTQEDDKPARQERKPRKRRAGRTFQQDTISSNSPLPRHRRPSPSMSLNGPCSSCPT